MFDKSSSRTGVRSRCASCAPPKELGIAPVAFIRRPIRRPCTSSSPTRASASARAARDSYLNVLVAGGFAKSRRDAVHPGYGFFRKARFAEILGEHNITSWPAPRNIRIMGDKIEASALRSGLASLACPFGRAVSDDAELCASAPRSAIPSSSRRPPAAAGAA